MENRKAVRHRLHHLEVNPLMTIKVEFWQKKILVFGLSEKVEDYYVFDTIFEVENFIRNNYDLQTIGV